MAATIRELRENFEKFCAFGRGSVGSSLDSLSEGSTMDGQKWAKFARDSGLIDGKKITTTEIDIIFSKVKAKDRRRIDWGEFKEALKMVAAKKYPDKHKQDAFTQVMYDVCVKADGPQLHDTTHVQHDDVVNRLTDVDGYTGTHKNRFDSEGHGLGLEGREPVAKTDQLSKIVSRDGPNAERLSVPGGSNRPTSQSSPKRPSELTNSEERLENIEKSPKKKTPLAGRRANEKKSTNNYGLSSNSSSQQSLAGKKNSSVNSSKGSVFDRLTDTSGYTGSHKERFNADGSGRGIAGRDAPSLGGSVPTYRGGNVKDLSQILRT